ncbi:histidine phosphatase superfamily [Mycena floridula]|nr:histidine phosphatase superfamily [Mycena floridula]
MSLLGVVLLARHGDRFYQSPTTYTATGTIITPLGNVQEFQLGELVRSMYLNASSNSFIAGVNSSIVDLTQVKVRADAGGEGGVILASAMSLVQGLFPANANYVTTLANGTTVKGPLGGYQYVTIESVEPANDVSLEGYTSCAAFDQNTAAFYNSSVFKQKAADNADFLTQLPPFLDGRPVTLENMWNIFDFMNVENIHSEVFNKALPPSFLAQARDLANFHEYGVFSSPQLDGIGNIAGRTILPSIISGLNSIANASDPLKFMYQALAYKPFLSLFNMTGVAQMNPQLAGIVDYAAAVALEVRNSTSGPVVRFTFKNGTNDDTFKTYNFLNASGDVPLSTFVNYLSPPAINTTAQWCTACGNTQDRGCGAIAAAAAAASKANTAVKVHDRISPVGAGFLGAGLAVFVFLAMFAVLAFLGILQIGRARTGRRKSAGSSPEPKA